MKLSGWARLWIVFEDRLASQIDNRRRPGVSPRSSPLDHYDDVLVAFRGEKDAIAPASQASRVIDTGGRHQRRDAILVW